MPSYCDKRLKYPGGICGQQLDRYDTCPNAKNHKPTGNTNKAKGYGKQEDTEGAHSTGKSKDSWRRKPKQ